jgi:hypothetical protein
MAWLPGEEALIRLWETLEKCGTGMLSPWQIRREGRARAEVRRLELLQEAQTKRDAEEILAGRLRVDATGKLLPSVPNTEPNVALPAPAGSVALPPYSATSPTLLEYASVREQAEGLKRLINLRTVARFAEEELDRFNQTEGKADKPPDDQSGPDDDWIAAWRRGAENVSAAKMQRLWARVLAGEVRAASSYSLRTLAFLQTLDVKDAELIQRLGPFAVAEDGSLIIKSDETVAVLESAGLAYGEMLDLEVAGLISGWSGLGGLQLSLKFQPGSTQTLDLRNGSVVVIGSPIDRDFGMGIVRVNRLGRELLTLGTFVPTWDYAAAIKKYLERSGLTADIQIVRR